jgi:hypothetical protein
MPAAEPDSRPSMRVEIISPLIVDVSTPTAAG